MNKTILVMCLILTLSVSVQGDPNDIVMPDEYATLRIMTEPEFKDGLAKAEVWAGYGKKASEAGLAVSYESWEEESSTESKWALGIFAMYHLPDVRPFIENVIWPAEWIPEGLTAKPAIGGSGLFDLDSKGIKVTPTLELVVYENWAIQIKKNLFSPNIDADDDWQIGLSMIWAF